MLVDRGINTAGMIKTFMQNNARNQHLFDQLFLYVKNNISIKHFLAAIEIDLEKKSKTDELFLAIKNGDANTEIFNDKNCHFYLLHLIKTEKISFDEGMTIYIYLTVLMQFTSRQDLKESDEKFKMLRDVEVIKLSQEKILTENGKSYLKKICDNLTDFIGSDCYEELVKIVLALPLSEQWLIKISYSYSAFIKSSQFNTGFDYLLDSIVNSFSVPFLLQLESGRSKEKHFALPSLSIIKFCLQKISPSPVNLQFAFGSVGYATLHALHANNKHPIPMYVPDVKSNVTSVHQSDCGPIGAVIHDYAHAFWGSLLSMEFKKLIYHFLIPNFKILQEEACNNSDTKIVKTIENVINQWGDFDLIEHAVYPEDSRHLYYLETGFHYPGSMQYAGAQKIGERPYDTIFFLMESLCLQKKNWSDAEKKIWCDIALINEKLINANDRYSYRENPALICDALRMLAKNTLSHAIITDSYFSDEKIHWNEWLKLLNQTTDSKEIWEIAKKERNEELLILITKYNLVFFHPYLPMTQEKRLMLIQFLENKIHAQPIV